MRSLSWYLARHYIPFQKGEYAITTMTIISFMSIAIGSFALALITAVMNGFQISIHEKMQSIHPQATIYSPKDFISYPKLRKALHKEFPCIKTISPYKMSHVMLRSDAMENDDLPIVSLIKAIQPEKESHATSLSQKVVAGSLSAIADDGVMIGVSMANSLDVGVGDSVSLLFLEPPSSGSRKIAVNEKSVKVVALFKTGIDEFDSKTVYSSFKLFDELFAEQGVSQVGLAFTQDCAIPNEISLLKKRTGLNVLTWQELYLPLVSALILEKYAMFLILLLITIVASMNIIALLFMIITHKRSDIAILRAMGLSTSNIARSFVYLGVAISTIAAAFGLVCAWIASWLLEHYPFIQLPDVYFVSHLPAKMEFSIVGLVFLLVVVISFLASWFSARRVSAINIAQILRFEG